MPLSEAQSPVEDALFQSSVASLAQKQFTAAEMGFKTLRGLEPDNLRGLMGMVQVRLAQRDVDTAIRLLQDELTKDPSNALLHLALGDTAARAGRFDVALAEYQQTLERAKPNVPADLYLNGPGSNPDLVEQAVHILTGQEDRPHGLEGVYVRIAELSIRKGDLKGALAAAQKAVELNPSATNLTNAAMLLESDGQKEAAARAYRATLLVNANNPIALNNLAYLMSNSGGDLDEALQYAKKAEALSKGHPELSDTVGWIYLKKGDSTMAIVKFTEAFRLAPANKSYRDHLAQALANSGNGSPAAEALQEALKAQPSAENQQRILDLLNRLK